MDEPRDILESADVHRVAVDGLDVVLVGTAHVSRESADLVQRAIETLQPSSICVELDAARLAQLRDGERFESLDLKQVIRQQQLAALLLNLMLASYQHRLGGKLGVLPGAEFIAAVEAAERLDIPVVLGDRNVRATLRRAWATLRWREQFLLLGTALAAAFESPNLTEEDLRELRQQDAVTSLIDELGRHLPGLRTVLIDERDRYLAESIRLAPGPRVLAIVGAGHVRGIREELKAGRRADLAALDTIPTPSSAWRLLGWSVPAAIVAAIAWIGWRHGVEEAGNNILFWIAVTGVPSMVATLLAAAHPLTALTALLAAPVTTLTPVLGVGYIAAFVEAWMRPPRVHELRSAVHDINSPRRWWSNRLLRILLVFVLSSLGGSLGMLFGSAEIARKIFR